MKEHMHPCGHGSWHLVEYLDFRDAGTACPDSFVSGAYSERPHVCSTDPSGGAAVAYFLSKSNSSTTLLQLNSGLGNLTTY